MNILYKIMEKKCKNCICYDPKQGICKVGVFFQGEKYNLPVFPNDNCHLYELGIPVQEIRWFIENNKVKVEYPI